MPKSNGLRRVNKADGTKKLSRRAMAKSHRHDNKSVINEQIEDAKDEGYKEGFEEGFEEALQIISIKLLDGGERKDPNTIRAEAVARAREIRAHIKRTRKGLGL